MKVKARDIKKRYISELKTLREQCEKQKLVCSNKKVKCNSLHIQRLEKYSRIRTFVLGVVDRVHLFISQQMNTLVMREHNRRKKILNEINYELDEASQDYMDFWELQVEITNAIKK